MKKKFAVRITALAVIVAVFASVMVQAQSNAKVDYGEKLDELAQILKDYHINTDPNDDPIRRGLITMFEENPGTFEAFANIMYQSYDPYSYYVGSEVYDSVYSAPSVKGGIGVTITQQDDGCYVEAVVKGSPAEQSGIQSGDKLVAVDKKNIEGYTPSMIGDLVSGSAGTAVDVTVKRGEERLTFTITRQPLSVSTVSFEDMGGGVAYIKISRMDGYETFLSFCQYYDYLEENGFKSIILDLRDNAGGDLDCLINLMDQIIPDKDMPYMMVRQGKPMKINTYLSEGYGWEFNSMTILVNENTGSAAEVMAGALQDLGYAEVVGVPTMGKGLGQRHIQLEDGSYAIVSTIQMFLPLTGSYNGKGIIPRHYVELEHKTQSTAGVEKLDPERGVTRAMAKNVKGIEQRLKKMGFFEGVPDDTADTKTFHAVNMFQRSHGMDMTDSRCDAATVRAIDSAYNDFISKPVVNDTQLAKAKALARSAASGNKKPEPIDPKSVRFTNE